MGCWSRERENKLTDFTKLSIITWGTGTTPTDWVTGPIILTFASMYTSRAIASRRALLFTSWSSPAHTAATHTILGVTFSIWSTVTDSIAVNTISACRTFWEKKLHFFMLFIILTKLPVALNNYDDI